MKLLINGKCNINCLFNLTNPVSGESGGGGDDPSPPVGSGVLLASDFTYAGHYYYANSLAEGMNYGNELTHRYVDGQLRFLAIAYNDNEKDVIEFALPEGPPTSGLVIRAVNITNTWPGQDIWNIFAPGKPNFSRTGIWWEDLGGGDGRLWSTMGTDYPDPVIGGPGGNTQSIAVRKLHPSGVVSDFHGPWGFQGVSQRCVSGKVQKNPQWFQDEYGVGPYLYGFGGTSSLMLQGGTISLGLFALAGPDVSVYPSSSVPYGEGNGTDWSVPSGDFSILADHRSGIENEDMDTQVPPRWDRGHRLTYVESFYGDPEAPPNDATDAQRTYYESHDPSPGTPWQSPGPDGKNRWAWGDHYFDTTCWVDGPNKKGLVCTASLTSGWAGYVNSQITGDGGAAEIHVFDPSHLGEVKQGTRLPCNVQPSMVDITPLCDSLGMRMSPRGNEWGGPVGGTYDPITKTYWVSFTFTDGGSECVLMRFDVNC